MKRKMNASNDEPEQRTFELPSEREHLLQIVDILPSNDENLVITKIEVAEGDETGRSLLHRVSLDSEWKGFFLTRLFLKAIGEPYKGEFEACDDNWIGRRFYATIVHNLGTNGKLYANIDKFNFDRTVEQEAPNPEKQKPAANDEVAWDDE